jgi:hypothetical protein
VTTGDSAAPDSTEKVIESPSGSESKATAPPAEKKSVDPFAGATGEETNASPTASPSP